MSKFFRWFLVSVVLVLLTACGGGGSGEPVMVTKVIMDDPIVGLNYKCSPSAEGDIKQTTHKGEFTCQTDDKVTFYVGKYKIGSTDVSSGTADTLRIADLGVAEDAVTDVRQLLQTIDKDKNDDVITIPKGYDKLDDEEVKPGDKGFDGNLSEVLGKPLVDATDANAHADESYLRKLLAGKTFYNVEPSYEKGDSLLKVTFNDSVTEVTELHIGGTNAALTQTLPVKVKGDRLYLSEQDYYKIKAVKSEYYAVDIFYQGVLDDTLRSYFDKAKAEAYMATLSGGGSGNGADNGSGGGSDSDAGNGSDNGSGDDGSDGGSGNGSGGGSDNGSGDGSNNDSGGGTDNGSGNDSNDSLPTPTGKIDKEKADELQQFIGITGMYPTEILALFKGDGGSSGKMSKVSRALAKDIIAGGSGGSTVVDFFGTYGCHEGTYTYERISGVHPYEDPDVTASKFIYKATFNECDTGDGIKQTGVKTRTWDWTRQDNVFTNNWSGSTENFVYVLDETHKYTTTSASWSGETVEHKDAETEEIISGSYTKHYVRSGKLEVDGKILEFKNIKRDKTKAFDNQNHTWSSTWKISGALSGEVEDFNSNGWLIVDTPVVLEGNRSDGEYSWNSCNHTGKMTVTGADHVVTTEVHGDHSITVKYDDTLLRTYQDCVEYHEKGGESGGVPDGGSNSESDNGSSSSQTIVGTWRVACHKWSTEYYQTVDVAFESDGTGTYKAKLFTDNQCTEQNATNAVDFTYEIKGSAEDSNGKSTTKLDLIIDPQGENNYDYTMYRFDENGHLLIADSTDGNPGDSDATRANDISPNDEDGIFMRVD